MRGYAELLQRERKDADYWPTEALEPYTEKQADHASAGRISLVEDVRETAMTMFGSTRLLLHAIADGNSTRQQDDARVVR